MNILQSKRKYFSAIAFLLILIILTFYPLIKGYNQSQVVDIVKSINFQFVALGLVVIFCFICCEAFNTRILMKSFGHKLKLINCIKYAAIGFYFSAITPSATGGQPAQIYYMKRDDIPIALSSITLLILIAIYQIVMLLYGMISLIIKFDFVMSNTTEVLLYLAIGVILNLIMVAFIFAIIFSKTLVKRFLLVCLSLLCKINIVKNKQKSTDSLTAIITEYQNAAIHIKKNPLLLLKVFLITIVQLTLLFSIPFLSYRAFSLSGSSFFSMLSAQSLLTIAVASLPLPGAVFISERIFTKIFVPFFGSILTPAMVVSRGISYYIPMVICGIVSVLVHFCGNKKHNKTVELKE